MRCACVNSEWCSPQAAAPATSPFDMFRSQGDKYGAFDDQGVPTHDASGNPITDSQRKKLRKQWLAQEKKFSKGKE